VQTVKADGGRSAGLFARPEWEFAAKNDQPILDDRTPIRALLGDKTDAIVPIFDVLIERRSWIVEADGATIEAVLDRGEAVAGERRTPICEVELEHKRGPHAALFDLARRIDAVAPVRLGALSKSDRGYRLLGPAEAAVKADRIALKTDISAAEGFQWIAHACLRQFRLNEALLLDHRDSRALHQARVALRRLRSAITIHKAMLGDVRVDRLRADLRWLAGELADARTIDVLIGRVRDKALRARMEKARDEAYAAAEAALVSDRARGLMLDLAEWIAIGDWLKLPLSKDLRERPVREFASQSLDRFRRKVKKSGRDLAGLDDGARHEVRKAAKKLRYAADFFAALYDRKREKRRHKRFIAALEDLQDRLGALNDLAVAPELLGRLGLLDEPGAARLLAVKHKAKLLDAAADAHEMLVDAKPFWR
jgi:inorganic triphosphatase YgiF